MKTHRFNLILILIFFSLLLNGQLQSSIDSCQTIQPDPELGFDAEIFSCAEFNYNTMNFGSIQDICATTWTRNGYESTIRSLIRFDLSNYSSSTNVKSAYLTLYHNPSSPEGSHSPLTGANNSVIKRIVSAWQENTVTWNNQPQTTTINQVMLPATTSPTEDFINIDITQLVKDAIDNPTGNFGFMMQLQTEQYYRKLVFCSSDHPIDSLRPKLVVCRNTQINAIEPDSATNFKFSVYPNPTSHSVTIDFGQNVAGQLYISSINGSVIKTISDFSNQILEIDLTNIESGIYFLKFINSKTGNISYQKLIISK